MNSLKQSMRLSKIFAFALSFLMFCLPTAAMAATDVFTKVLEGPVSITEGGFSVHKKGEVNPSQTIVSAQVLLPESESGTIDQIKIIGPDGKPEFQCENVFVKKGTDLIKECGSQAHLKEGETSYLANGSGFGPSFFSTLKILLVSET